MSEGKWKSVPQEGALGHCFQAQVFGPDGHCVAIFEPTSEPNDASILASQAAEAFNVANETGMTPRQLADRVQELEGALSLFVSGGEAFQDILWKDAKDQDVMTIRLAFGRYKEARTALHKDKQG